MRGRAVLAGAAVLSAAVLHLALQAGMMLTWPGWRPSSFRDYFWPDQLSYLSIATNVSQGASADVEPYTLTGSISYPRAWYVLLGRLADLTGTSPATMWTVCGLGVQVALVCTVGVTCVLLTRRWWTGLLGFVPFLLGTGSWILSGGTSWMTVLGSHAVLWGPYGVLYTLNGETAALSLGAIALLAMMLVAAGRVPERAALPVSIAACALVGSLANVHTYAFLVSTFVLAGGVAAYGLVRWRSRAALLTTVGLVVLVVVAGPLVADALGRLAVLALGIAPAVPGVLLVLRAGRWRPLWAVAALAACASPQVLATGWGLVQHDPFLTYREASSKDLGVPAPAGVFSALGVVPALALVAVLGVRRRQTVWVAVPCALLFLWAYLASNDRWGANQEPYRFWLDVYVLVAVLVVPLLAWSVIESLAGSRSPAAPAPVRGRTFALALAACVAVAAVWSGDFLLFRPAVTAAGYLPLGAPQYRAQADLLDRTRDEGGLVEVDGCVDPTVVNAVWGGPVASYNLGLAWPDHRVDLDRADRARTEGHLDQVSAVRAGIRWLMVVPGCPTDLTAGVRGEPVATATSDGSTWVLWHLDR